MIQRVWSLIGGRSRRIQRPYGPFSVARADFLISLMVKWMNFVFDLEGFPHNNLTEDLVVFLFLNTHRTLIIIHL